MSHGLSNLPPKPSDELVAAYESARRAHSTVRRLEDQLANARRNAKARSDLYERMAAEALGQMRLIDTEDDHAG